MKKSYWVLIGLIILIILFIVFRIGGEDSWIKDKRGVWIRHGYPSQTPEYVKEQQQVIDCALQLYDEKKIEGVEFSSQCLGICEYYAVDIVNVPRNEDDNKIENQCEAYREGEVNNFIELDKNGEIVRIV